MLAEAEANCERFAVTNATLRRSDAADAWPRGVVDFAYSAIVFQHIPVGPGLGCFARLVASLRPGGFGVAQLTYDRTANLKSLKRRVIERTPGVQNLINLARGRGFFEPRMQMNAYDLNRVFRILQDADAPVVAQSFTNHGGHLGVTLCFRRRA